MVKEWVWYAGKAPQPNRGPARLSPSPISGTLISGYKRPKAAHNHGPDIRAGIREWMKLYHLYLPRLQSGAGQYTGFQKYAECGEIK